MKTFSLFFLVTCFSFMSYSQGSQDFEDVLLPPFGAANYADGDFIEGGITYHFFHARDQDTFNISGQGLMLRRASDSYLEYTIPNGIGNLSFDYRKAYTGGTPRQLEVYINGIVTYTTDEFGEGTGGQWDVYTFNEEVNVEGSVTIKIKNVGETTGNRQAVIDNIVWTAYELEPGVEYCIPTYTSGCEIGGFINDFVLMGENGSSIEEIETGCSTDGYDDRTEAVDPVNLLQGELYNFQIKTNAGGVGAAVWIDFDNDGVFSASEMITFGPLTSGVLTSLSPFTDNIPIGATPGTRRMRVSVTNNIPNDPCATYAWGETHDYLVNIVALGGCTGTPEAGTVSNFNVCAGSTFDLSTNGVSIGEPGLSYQWQISANGTTWTDMANANTATYIVTDGVLETTYFRLVVTCDNSEETATSDAIEVTIDSCYCVPEGTNPDHYINNFTTTGGGTNITNLGTGFSYQGYGDFSGMIVEKEKNGELFFEADMLGETYGFRIWVDWNQDGVFTADEVAFSSESAASSVSGSFIVPETATTGPTRMRIVCDSNSETADVDPCETGFSFGEFEDYTLMVLGDTGCTNFTANIDGDSSICEGETTTLTVTASANIESIEWNTGETDTEITVSTSGTYTATVISEDGCEEVVSMEVIVTLLPTVGEITVIDAGNGTYILAPVDALSVVEYAWEFGDGESSSAMNPTHTYTDEGTYTVTLTVSNDCGSASVTETIVYGTSGLNEIDLIALNVFPNPANEFINFVNESSFEMESIMVVSSIGKTVFNTKVNDNNYQLDVTQLTRGIYHVNIILNNGNVVQRKFAVIN